MRKLVLIMMVFTSFAINTVAQEIYKAADIPATLRQGASAVVRNMETTVTMENQESVIMTVKSAVTILNKGGEDHANLVLPYNKTTSIKNAKGYILDAHGNPTSKFSLSNFVDQSAISSFSLYEDDRIKYYNPVITAYPVTIVYEYELRFKQNFVLPDWYANPYPDLAIEKSSYTFRHNPLDKIRVKAYNYSGKIDEQQFENMISLGWSVKDIPAFKQEPYAPAPDNYRTYVKIAPEQFTYYRAKGNFSNWNELGKWIYTDLVKSRQELSPVVIAEMKNLVQGLSSDREKAKKIYEYMQQKTRYISVQIGIGGFQPMFARDVDRLGYGDCKALVSYMQSLLKAVDIPSYYCVVYAGRFKQDMDPEFASMDQGNHVILCLPLDGDTTWLECTSQTMPFGFLGDFTDDRTVLACTEDSGKLLRTPVLTAQMNETKREAKLNVDQAGNISGTMNTSFKGAQYDTYESIIRKPIADQITMLKEYYDIDNINFEQVKISQKKTAQPETNEQLSLKITAYIPKNQQTAYLVPNAFNRLSTTRSVSDRKLPVHINRGYTEEDELTYHFPDGYVIDFQPKDIALKSPFGTFNARITQKGNELHYSRKFVLNSGSHAAKDYAAFAEFMNQIASADRGKVVFKTN